MTQDVQSFSGMLRNALGDRLAKDADGFVDMVADEVVMEFPFAPEGLPKRIEGREAIAAHLTALGSLIAFDRMGTPQVLATADPNVTVLEFEGFGTGVENGEPYDQRYVSIITTEAGRIVHYRDYWNPLVILRTLKGAAVDETISLDGTFHE